MPPVKRLQAAEQKLTISNRQVFSHRQRLLPADIVVAPGTIVLPAINPTGYGYRIVQINAIANGGAAAGITSLDLTGTQAKASVNLAVIAVTSLTQSTLVKLGDAGVTILANGASFAVCDPNTPIRVVRVGAALTGATSIDLIVGYTVEKV